jgi:hypothetical protein
VLFGEEKKESVHISWRVWGDEVEGERERDEKIPLYKYTWRRRKNTPRWKMVEICYVKAAKVWQNAIIWLISKFLGIYILFALYLDSFEIVYQIDVLMMEE